MDHHIKNFAFNLPADVRYHEVEVFDNETKFNAAIKLLEQKKQPFKVIEKESNKDRFFAMIKVTI